MNTQRTSRWAWRRGALRRSWTTRSEQTGHVLVGGGRPDILIEEASGLPVVVEAEKSDRTGAENEAESRLGRVAASSGGRIETAIALVYPATLHALDGPALRTAIRDTGDLEFALYTYRPEQVPERLPSGGWLSSDAFDLAMLVHRAAVRPVGSFLSDGVFLSGDLCQEWATILAVNYWPIFWSAKEMVGSMPAATAHVTIDRLWRTSQKLVAGGVTRSHDLTGLVFQRLISDRKFLATYYTQPEAAAFLSALAIPKDKPPGGADW